MLLKRHQDHKCAGLVVQSRVVRGRLGVEEPHGGLVPDVLLVASHWGIVQPEAGTRYYLQGRSIFRFVYALMHKYRSFSFNYTIYSQPGSFQAPPPSRQSSQLRGNNGIWTPVTHFIFFRKTDERNANFKEELQKLKRNRGFGS